MVRWLVGWLMSSKNLSCSREVLSKYCAISARVAARNEHMVLRLMYMTVARYVARSELLRSTLKDLRLWPRNSWGIDQATVKLSLLRLN